MALTRDEVEHIAKLAHLKLTDEETERFTHELDAILQYVEKLNELNTDGVEPLRHSIELTNVYREDKVSPSLPVEEALRNAPSRTGNYFKVPKVVK